MKRKNISVVLFPGPTRGITSVNGNALSNEYCVTMLKEWLVDGEELTLTIVAEGLPNSNVSVRLKKN